MSKVLVTAVAAYFITQDQLAPLVSNCDSCVKITSCMCEDNCLYVVRNTNLHLLGRVLEILDECQALAGEQRCKLPFFLPRMFIIPTPSKEKGTIHID